MRTLLVRGEVGYTEAYDNIPSLHVAGLRSRALTHVVCTVRYVAHVPSTYVLMLNFSVVLNVRDLDLTSSSRILSIHSLK